MNIAFIAPYEGKRKHQQDYDAIIRALEDEGVNVISAEKTELYEAALKSYQATHHPSEAHYNFIRKAIIDSDAVVAEVTHEDFQMGHEATLALLYRKPVLTMSQNLDHGKYIPHPDFRGVHYEASEIPDIIQAFVSEVRQQQPTIKPSGIVPSISPDAKATHKRIAVFGGISADILNQVAAIPGRDEVALSKTSKISLGGKATNAAVAMARLGNEVLLLGQVGHDSMGVDLEAVLVHEGIKTDFLARNHTYPTGTVVLAVDDSARYSTVVHEAANVHIDKQTVDQLFERIDNGDFSLDCLYFTLEPQPEAIDHIVREAHARGIFIFCDAAPHVRPLDTKLLSLVDVIAPNQVEVQAMTDIEVTDRESAAQAANRLQSQGAKEVIITLGKHGAYYINGEGRSQFVPARSVDAIDEAGAGDAFRAAFVTELLLSGDASKSLASGTKAGAFAVTHFGSYDSMPTSAALELFG